MQTGWKLKRPSPKQQKEVQDIRSGRTGSGFGRGMTKYKWQQKKIKLVTGNIYKKKNSGAVYRIQKTPINSKKNNTKAKER